MKNRNNKGFGFALFLTFMGVFFIAIIMIAVLANYYGIGIKEHDNNAGTVEAPDYEKYHKYEERIRDAAKSYTSGAGFQLPSGGSLIIDITILNISSNITNLCTGYVKIGDDNGLYHHPYIKCDQYTTPGYQAALDE